MDVERFAKDVHKRFCELDDDAVAKAGALDVLVAIASDEARKHPLRYEVFRLRAVVTRVWRWLTK